VHSQRTYLIGLTFGDVTSLLYHLPRKAERPPGSEQESCENVIFFSVSGREETRSKKGFGKRRVQAEKKVRGDGICSYGGGENVVIGHGKGFLFASEGFLYSGDREGESAKGPDSSKPFVFV